MASDFTVDRASKKYVLGSDGFLKEYANDAPAIEFNADGSYKGVLVEPESVNESKASEDLDNGTYWTPANTTIAGDTETDPKGGTNSFLLSEDATNSFHTFVTASAQRPSIASGETWTQSVFVKKGDGANAPDIVQLTHGTAGFGTQYANFDISVGGGTSGTVTASSGGTAGIRYYANGWYRISWTATSTGADDAFIVLVLVNNNPTAGRLPSYAGQTDANVFVWGAQVEESPIATSYIPTPVVGGTSSSVTRVKDDIYLTSASSLIGQTEGTLFVEVDWQEASSATITQTLLSAHYDVDNRIKIYKDTDDYLNMFVQEGGGATEYDDGVDASAYTGIQKIAFAYDNGDVELYVNGSSVKSGTPSLSGFASPLANVEFAQDYNAGNQANMWIRAVALFTTRLSDAKCEDLTTI